MAFGKFPLFGKRKESSSISEETYPATKKFRDHKNLIESNADRSVDHFEKKFVFHLQQMFDHEKTGRIHPELLTDEEAQDVKNFIAYASKRLAAGAIASPSFHQKVQAGKPAAALYEFAPPSNVGHDSVHSLMAYARTGGESLVPAYMKTERLKGVQSYGDPDSNLEEAYVIAFSELGEFEKWLRTVRLTKGYAGEELVNAVMEEWETDITKLYGFKFSDPEFVKSHRLLEFVAVIRNLAANMDLEIPDKNFEIHEFQRIAGPLLERLRSKAD